MSTDWTDRVWAYSKQKGSAKLLLLAIAHVADESGSTTALSIAALEHLVGTKERNTQVLLAKLEHAGELRREFGAGPFGRTRSTVLYPALPEKGNVVPVHLSARVTCSNNREHCMSLESPQYVEFLHEEARVYERTDHSDFAAG